MMKALVLLIILLARICVAQLLGSDTPVYTAAAVALTRPTVTHVWTNTATASTSISITDFTATNCNYVVIGVDFQNTLARTLTGLTVNGVSATNIYTTNYISSSKTYLYGLVNPTTGTITATFNSSVTSISMIAMSFNHVGGNGASSGDFSSSSRSTTSDGLTTLATDLVVDTFAYNVGLVTATPGGGQTLQAIASNAGASLDVSTQPGTAGTTTMSWSLNVAGVVTWLGVVLNGQ